MTDTDFRESGAPEQQLYRARQDMREWLRIRKERKLMEAARDSKQPTSDNEDQDSFGNEDVTPGEADHTQAGDFSVTTKTAIATRISASFRSMTVNSETTCSVGDPGHLRDFSKPGLTTPNISVRAPEHSFLQNQTPTGKETVLGTIPASINEETAAVTLPMEYRVGEQMEIDRRGLEEKEEHRRLLGQASDSEESISGGMVSPQPPLTFPGCKTLSKVTFPCSRLLLVPRLCFRHSPLEGGRPQDRGHRLTEERRGH